MFQEVNDATYAEAFAATRAGLCLFFKNLCPHCKNMGKVMEKFQALEPEAAFLSINIEENPQAAGACEAQRAPTMLVIRNGKVAGRKAGLMNPRELHAFFKESSGL